MRKVLVAAALLVGVGLVLFFWVGAPEGPEAPAPTGVASPSEPRRASSSVEKREGVARPPNSDGVDARDTAAGPGSTPPLEQPASEADGVLDVEVVAKEKPVPGASVRLYWHGERDPNLGEVSWRVAGAGPTDAQGHARLASKPGQYQVAVHAQGYAPLLRDVVRPSGEARTPLRLTLEPGQLLTGRTVVRGSGEPLPMVELVLTQHGRPQERWPQIAEAPAEERVYAASDARGDFRLEGLAPGRYMLEARAPGHARAVQRSVEVPAASPLTVALQVAAVIEGFVVDGQDAPVADAEVQVSGRVPQATTSGQGGGFSVEVEPGTYTLSARRGEAAGSLEAPVSVSAGKTLRDVKIRLGQGAALEGLVVAQATGTPIAGASVDVSPFGRNGDSGRAVTDGTGHFSVGGLAPGSYDLSVSAPAFSSEIRRGLTVASGESFPLEIRLKGTGAVEGQVKDEAGQPVQGVQVTGVGGWGSPLGSTPAQARTDAEGHYRIDGLEAGPVVLTASRDGATLGERQRVAVKEGDTARADFTLKETGSVDGVVRAASGRLPAESLSVIALQMGGMRFRMGPDIARADLEASGHFRMTLPPGRYGLRVVPRERLGLAGFESTEIRVEAGKTAQVEMTWQEEASDSALLRGVVLEPEGAASVGATVMLSSDSGARGMGMVVITDEEGRFSFAPPPQHGTPAGGMRVIANNGGRRGELPVKAGEQQDVVVKLQPAASVRGQVVRASGGAPVKGFSLSVVSQDRSRFPGMGGTWEFPGDRFVVNDVPAEPAKLVVRTQDGAVGEAPVSLAAGASAEVQVVLKAMAGLRGRVVDAITKEPLPQALIFLESPAQGRPGPGPELSSDGRFTLNGLSPGESTLVIMAEPLMPRVRRPVTLVEGQVLDLGDIAVSSK